MMFTYCWHRPGRKIGEVRGELGQLMAIHSCRHCGIGIVVCPCGPQKRNEEPCRACEGSGWVGIVRSKITAMNQMLFEETA